MAVVLMDGHRQSGGLHSGGDVTQLLPQRRCCSGIGSAATRRVRQTSVNQSKSRSGVLATAADLMVERGQRLRRARRDRGRGARELEPAARRGGMIGRGCDVEAALGDAPRVFLVALPVQPVAEHAEHVRRRPAALVAELHGSLQHRRVFVTHAEGREVEAALGEPLGEIELALRQRPQVRGAEVVPFHRHPFLALDLTRATDHQVQLGDQIGVVRGMAVAQQRGLAAELHLVLAVLAQRLQQPVAHAHRAAIEPRSSTCRPTS